MKNNSIQKWYGKYYFSGGGVIFLLFVLCVVIFFSCRKKIATDTTLERTNALKEKFRNVLTSSSYGWIVCIRNNQGVSYNFFMHFDKNERVKMQTDYKPSMLTLKESAYTIKLLQQPTLSFNTYNYLSTLSDPDLPYSGYRTDFEFAFSQELADLLMTTESVEALTRFTLHGILYDSEINFIRAQSAQDAKIFERMASIEKLIAALKWTNTNTVNVLEFKNKSVKYHYNCRQINHIFKLFAFTSLEKNKKGASMNYYFDICGNGRIAMKFKRNKYLHGIFENLDLKTELENMEFTNFVINADSTKITFDCRNAGKLTQGYLYALPVTSLPKEQLATEKDTLRFHYAVGFFLDAMIEKGKMEAWDLAQNGTIYPLVFEKSVTEYNKWYLKIEKNYRSLALIFKASPIQRMTEKYVVKYGWYDESDKGVLWETSWFGPDKKYTGGDLTSYLTDANKQNFIQKVDSTAGNTFYILATNRGYELHNPSKSLVMNLNN